MKHYLRGASLALVAVFGIYKVFTWFASGALGQWPMTTADAIGLFVLLFTSILTFCIAMEDLQ